MLEKIISITILILLEYHNSNFIKIHTEDNIYNLLSEESNVRMFTSTSPLNQKIPKDAQYLENSLYLLENAGIPGIISLNIWSIPIFDIYSNTKVNLSKISCNIYKCEKFDKLLIPVPDGIFSEVGSDHSVTIIDNQNRIIYNFWLWKKCWFFQSEDYCPGGANYASFDSDGINGGINVAKLAGGILRTNEIEQELIEHALLFSTPTSCKDSVVYPAIHSDGKVTDKSKCIEIGSRLQLDPSLNLDSIPGITQMEKIIAKALQVYGAYICDTGGKLGLRVENDRSGKKIYQKYGAPDRDYFPLINIPWDSVKILKPQWNKDGSKAYNWTDNN